MVDDFEAIHDPSPSSTTHHKEGHNLRQVTFQTDILSFVDKVSVPLSDNIKRSNMLAFANQPELMKQCSISSSKDAGVERHNMIMVAQIFLLLHSRQDANVAD